MDGLEAIIFTADGDLRQVASPATSDQKWRDHFWERGLPLSTNRSRANMAHIKQSVPDFGLGCQVKVLNMFKVFPLRSRAARHTTFDAGNHFRRTPPVSDTPGYEPFFFVLFLSQSILSQPFRETSLFFAPKLTDLYHTHPHVNSRIVSQPH